MIVAPTSDIVRPDPLRPWLPKLFRPLTHKDKKKLGLSSDGVVKRAKNGSVPGTYIIYIYIYFSIYIATESILFNIKI